MEGAPGDCRARKCDNAGRGRGSVVSKGSRGGGEGGRGKGLPRKGAEVGVVVQRPHEARARW